jgi:hypothetical protein
MLFGVSVVITNVAHAAKAAVPARQYLAPELADEDTRNATLWSYSRFSGPQFGGICFGSFILPLIAVRQSCASLLEYRTGNERLSIKANKYALARVAIYGRAWVEASQIASRLFSFYGIGMK